jgi:hypothetical protein
MKKVIVGITVALMIATGLQAQEGTKKSSGSHLGTWELASFKYGTNQPGFTDFPKTEHRIKLITETHYTWVEYDDATKKVTGSAGGTYSLDGNTYTESKDFGLNMDPYLGKKHVYSIRVEGDKFFLSGSLSDGLKIEEVWRRVK